MQYDRIQPGIFLSRPNRFIAHVELDSAVEVCHVKNTGRCRELLIPGAAVYVQEALNPARRTRFDLIAVEKGSRLINMDSQVPNRVVEEWIGRERPFGPYDRLRREVTKGASRFDLCLERPGGPLYIEVKGVTLEEDGEALFPDAPTQRGAKHLRELRSCVREGCEAAVVFLIQMKGVRCFRPNSRTDPAFALELRRARAAGVQILALDCDVTPSSIRAADAVPVRPEEGEAW